MQRFRGIGLVLVMGLMLAAVYGCALFNRAPIALLSATPTSGGAPLTVQFSGAGSYDPDGGLLTYAWSFGDGATATGASVTHTYTGEGQFTARLTVTDSQGSEASVSQSIVVSTAAAGSAPTAVFAASPSSGGTPLTVSFNAAGSSDADGSIVTYQWTFGDGSTGSGMTVLHSYLTQGTYTATLTVTDNDGRTSTTTQVIVVIDGGQGGCS